MDFTNLPLANDSNAIYQAQQDGSILALQSENGQLLWRTDVGGQIRVSPLSRDGVIYAASEPETDSAPATGGRSPGIIRALSRASGITLWLKSVPSPLRGSLAANHTSLFGGTADGHVYAIDTDTGELQWASAQQPSAISNILLDDAWLLAITESGLLVALEQKTGKTLWRYQTPAAFGLPILFALRTVFFGSRDGYVNAVTQAGGSAKLLWRKQAGTGTQTLSFSDKGLIVTTSDNFAYLLSLTKGRRLWKKQLPGRLVGQPLVTDDGALFAPAGESACIALSLKDGRQINTIFVGEDNAVVSEPTLAQGLLLVPTRHGLFAFAPVN